MTEHSGRFAIIPSRALDDQRIGNAAFKVLAALGSYANRDGWCWPSYGTLAQRFGVSPQAIAKQLKLDRSAAQRRVQAARERGYLVNIEEKRGRAARYIEGDAMPDEVELLPASVGDVQVCTDRAGSIGAPPSTEGFESDAPDPEIIERELRETVQGRI